MNETRERSVDQPSTNEAQNACVELKWSAWMPLSGAHPLALQQLSEAPGVYRVREERSHKIVCESRANEGLRQEVERLARQVQLPCPPSESNPLALCLWNLRRTSGCGFQVSGLTKPSRH